MAKNKGEILYDTIDARIMDFIKSKGGKATITQVKKIINITHPTLLIHLKRLEKNNLIKRERDKQTIYLEETKIPFFKLKRERGYAKLGIQSIDTIGSRDLLSLLFPDKRPKTTKTRKSSKK